MSFIDTYVRRMFGLQQRTEIPLYAAEANNPVPKEELPFIEPIGQANDLDQLSQKDRTDVAAVVAAALRSAQQQGRAARYADFEAMDTSDVSAMLDAVVDAILTFEDVSTGRGFKIEADEPAIQELLDRAIEQANLQQWIEEVCRDMLQYGDGFSEPIFEGGELVGCQTYDPKEIVVTRDDKGRLVAGKDKDGFSVAYQQRRNGRVVAGWEPWEMIHIKFWPSRRLSYSKRSLLDALRSDWRKLQMVEQGMVVARVARAYPKRVHYVDVTGKDRQAQEDTLKRYIQRMTQKIWGRKQTSDESLPIVDVSSDLYITTGYTTGPDGRPVPMLNKTEIEDPATAGLSELSDVQYLRQKIWAQVPSDIVGIKRNTMGDLDSQDIAFTRLLRRCQTQLEMGIRAILDQVLLANGRLPSTVTYRVTLPTVDVKGSWKHSDARFRASMTLRNYAEMGVISRRFMLKQAYNLSDKEIDEMYAEIADEATNPIFLPVDQAARNGAPSITGAVNKAGNDGDAPPKTADTIIPATGAVPGKSTTTKNGIDRGTKLGQRTRGHMSGG